MATPFLKWVGGKKRLLPKLQEFFPKTYNSYCEPFIGGGSVFFNFNPKSGYLSDVNETLINCYITIRDNLPELKEHLLLLENKNTEQEYYEIRTEFNKLRHQEVKDIVYISALMIYLNKAG